MTKASSRVGGQLHMPTFGSSQPAHRLANKGSGEQAEDQRAKRNEHSTPLLLMSKLYLDELAGTCLA